jgi:hypothetical protein
VSQGPNDVRGEIGHRCRRPPSSHRMDAVHMAHRSHRSVLGMAQPVLARIGPGPNGPAICRNFGNCGGPGPLAGRRISPLTQPALVS